ncbi:hypothetical protein KR044_010619, partial [Drosophila immigrans]
ARSGKCLAAFEAERQLIQLVSEQPALYNSRHARFKDDAYKELLWQLIANKLAEEPSNCMSLWAELRHGYQRHVLRQRRQQPQQQQRRAGRQRGCLLHEEQLLFLYPHVARQPLQRETLQLSRRLATRHHKQKAVADDDDDDDDEVTIVTPQPVIIDVDKDIVDEYKLNAQQLRLIDAVRAYPQLYDARLVSYANHRHRGLIWGAISNELREKATKLMKSWLQLQIRYEWELSHCKEAPLSRLRELLKFLEPHVKQQQGSVCKLSVYLRTGWHDPIEHFPSVCNLIEMLNTMPELTQLVDDYQHSLHKPLRYHEYWVRVAADVNVSHQRCEVSWLVLRQFYRDLAEMRKVGYQLQDKWFFENIIASLYKQQGARQARRGRKRSAASPTPPRLKYVPMGEDDGPPKGLAQGEQPPPLPLAIVYPLSSKATEASSNAPFVLPRIDADISVVPIKTDAETPAATTATTATAAATVAAAPSIITVVPNSILFAPDSDIGSSIDTTASSSTDNANVAAPASPSNELDIVAYVLKKPKGVTVRNDKVLMPSKLRPASNALATAMGTATTLEAATSNAAVTATAVATSIEAVAVTATPTATTTVATLLTPAPATATDATSAIGATTVTGKRTAKRSRSGNSNNDSGNSSKSMKNSSRWSKPTSSIQSIDHNIDDNSSSSSNSALTIRPVANSNSNSLAIRPAAKSNQSNGVGNTINIRSFGSTISIRGSTGGSSFTIRSISNNATQTAASNSNSKSCNSKADSPSAASSTTPAIKPTPAAQSLRVEFRDCPSTGRMLHVTGTGVPQQASLNMSRTAVFIREVMAIPQLHSKQPQMISKIDDLWQQFAKKVHLPDFVCRGIWTFLSHNINLFPQIAPMVDLMRPFKSSLKVWEKSHRLFSKFDEIARKYQWMLHKNELPILMQHFRRYEHLYCDMRRPRPGQTPATMRPRRIFTEQERAEVWRVAKQKFPQMNHRDVWSMFKFAFKTYMEDLERGIENPWPQNWWHALEQLKFLVNERYHPLDPYYYIVHNKFMEEVKRCSMYEALMQPPDDADGRRVKSKMPTLAAMTDPMPWETEEAKRLLVGELSQAVDVEQALLQADEAFAAQENDPEAMADEEEEEEEGKDVKYPPSDRGVFVKLPGENTLKLQLPVAELAQFIGHQDRYLPSISGFQLTAAMRLYSDCYGQVTPVKKRVAWMRVARELKSSVDECRLTLQHVLREQRLWRISDPSGRCALSTKHFRHMTEIYREVMFAKNAPRAVNQPGDAEESVFPERFIPEINAMTCQPSLVVKNWSYAIGHFPLVIQEELRTRLRYIFDKYDRLGRNQCPG